MAEVKRNSLTPATPIREDSQPDAIPAFEKSRLSTLPSTGPEGRNTPWRERARQYTWGGGEESSCNRRSIHAPVQRISAAQIPRPFYLRVSRRTSPNGAQNRLILDEPSPILPSMKIRLAGALHRENRGT
jgi:hypothetical protein